MAMPRMSEQPLIQRAPEKLPFQILRRALERGQLAHAYLFTGEEVAELENAAKTLAMIVNCSDPVRAGGNPIASCGRCPACRKIDKFGHPDVQWIRPESKSRVITIDQIRALMQTVNLKPAEARVKFAVIVCAERLNPEAANAFLKTLEEPPEHSVLLLLSTDPAKILETLISRCLRLHFPGESQERFQAYLPWLENFSRSAGARTGGLLDRYQLLGSLLAKLSELRAAAEATATEASPLKKYSEVEPRLREKWEDELAAATEAEYRRRREALLLTLNWWLRDLWLQTLNFNAELMRFPQLAALNRPLVERLETSQAAQNLRFIEETQQLLESNVQEALALEVGLLKLHL